MFLKNDIYTTSGSTKLYHCWTDKVTKFDSSSFYNWEQDNLPIYDLDERTNFLWEQLGYPASSVDGVALVVSADAPDNAIACNKNIFRSLSAAIEAIPQCINFPILIEVASFGNLGDLVISNRRFGPNGSLEIINRNFARQENTISSGAINSFGLVPPMIGVSSTEASNTFVYLSGVAEGIVYDASTIKISPLQGFLDSSCMSISAAVFSGVRDSRLSGVAGLSPTLNAYVSVVKSGGNYNRATLVIDEYNNIQPYGNNNFKLNFKAYDLNPDSFEDIQSKDASTLNYFNGDQIYLTNNYFLAYNYNIASLVELPEAGNEYTSYNGLYYGNKLNKIFINNCDGKIFIRNFFVYGGGRNRQDNHHGVEVNNSPNVFLESMVACKFRKTGFNFTNSRVALLRGCVATRIYDYDSDGFRLVDDYANRRKFLTYNTQTSLAYDDQAAGMLCNNSNIILSSTYDWEYNLYSSTLSPNQVTYIPSNHIFEFTKSANGIILNNSTLEGGKSIDISKTFPTLEEITFDMAHNTGLGLLSNNSKISIDGKIRFIENLYGAQLNNTVFEVDRLACVANQKQGISTFNSKILYNKNFLKNHIGGALWFEDGTPYIWFINNGQHLVMNNSVMAPITGSSMEDMYGAITFKDPIGKLLGIGTNEAFGVLEGVRLQNNSEAVLISPQFERSDSYSIESGGDPIFTKKGSELLVTNNSKAVLKGTKYFCTKAIGPSTYGNSRPLISLCAENNSMVQLNGPTIIAQFGVGLMGDSNSKVLLSAPRQLLDNSLDISSINLADGANHTAVEIHSVRTGIVVNNNSTFEAKDLGSFIKTWIRNSSDFSGWVGVSSLSSVELLKPEYFNNALDMELYTSAGSLQFYPNPIVRNTENSYDGSIKGVSLLYPAHLTPTKFTYVSSTGNYFLPANNTTMFTQNGVAAFSSLTYGGTCVRALNSSLVSLKNVNFPCGYWNASAPYYDGTLSLNTSNAAYKTFIWNISDDSQMKASYISVSSLFPKLTGYHGPKGFWGSGTAASSLNYGLPSSTPDTSGLSVLDLYGANPSSTAYSVSSHQNYGPFRLYLSVDPAVNSFVDATTLSGYGIIPQLYAQGYQPSSNLLCSGSPSSMYMSVLRRNSSGNIVPSGYYYSNEMVTNPSNARIILDESAAETFANAKHCSAGKSNLAKTVNIYYPYHGDTGGIIKFGDHALLYGIGSVNIFDAETIG
jgi:hypothetical protein